jgi:hypothetical protein
MKNTIRYRLHKLSTRVIVLKTVTNVGSPKNIENGKKCASFNNGRSHKQRAEDTRAYLAEWSESIRG